MESELNPRLKEAAEGKRKVFFVDAAHFVMGAFLSCVWSFRRLFIPTPAGRKRYNVLGAVCAVSKRFVSVSNDTQINAVSVCELLNKLRCAEPVLPITVILDNARYQHCDKVKSHALKLGVELLFLPSYSPNLNLIERLWKWLKRDCLYGKYYPLFDSFKKAIDESLRKVGKRQYKKSFDSLLSWKFQLFEDVDIMS